VETTQEYWKIYLVQLNKEDNNMRFLISGGAGFIGSNIVMELVKLGHDVMAIDNLITGSKKNLEEVMGKIEFVWDDLRKMDVCKNICGGVDYILHQAALGSVPRSVKDPVLSNENNINSTLNLLVAAKDAGVRRFVYASSSGVYGNCEGEFKVETMESKPINPYAISKTASEEYVKIFHKLYGMKTVALRYFNVFGPQQNPHGAYAAVVPAFILNALNYEKSIIYGDGKQARDFTFVDDVVQANILACQAGEEVDGQAINVGGGHTVSVNKLHEMIGRFTDCPLEPNYVDKRKGDVMNSRADIGKAIKLLGYKPYSEKTFEECIGETVEWYRSRHEAQRHSN